MSTAGGVDGKLVLARPLPEAAMVEVDKGGMYALESLGKQKPGWKIVWMIVAKATMLLQNIIVSLKSSCQARLKEYRRLQRKENAYHPSRASDEDRRVGQDEAIHK